jgi:hypothetical protein
MRVYFKEPPADEVDRVRALNGEITERQTFVSGPVRQGLELPPIIVAGCRPDGEIEIRSRRSPEVGP